MNFEAAPIAKYIYNQTGELGGYPMADIVEKEMAKHEQIGGKEIGFSKFENLVIPAGLVAFSNDYYTPKLMIAGSQNKTNIKEKNNEHMDNDLFNKVFDLITKCPKHRSKQTTKKIINNVKSAITKKKH